MTFSALKLMVGVAAVVLLFAGKVAADEIEPPPAVPEPATLTLLAIGGAGAYLLKRRT